MSTIYGKVRLLGAAEPHPGADSSDGSRPLAVTEEGHAYTVPHAKYDAAFPVPSDGDVLPLKLGQNGGLLVESTAGSVTIGTADQGNPGLVTAPWPVKLSDGVQAIGTSAHPVITGKPSRIARAAHLASAALPAAGAYTSQAAYAVPDGLRSITFWLSYTRDPAGADTGYPVAKVLWGNGTEEAPELVVDDTIVAQTGDHATFLVWNGIHRFPAPSTDAEVVFQVSVEVPAGATTARLLVAEEGDTTNPGTADVFLTGGY